MQIGFKARKPKRLVPDPTTSRNQNQLPTPQAWWAQSNPSPEHPVPELPPARPVNRGAEALLEWYLESCRGLPRDLESSPHQGREAEVQGGEALCSLLLGLPRMCEW